MPQKTELQSIFRATRNLGTPDVAEKLYNFLVESDQFSYIDDEKKESDLGDKMEFLNFFFNINKFSKYSLNDFLGRKVALSSRLFFLRNKSKTNFIVFNSSKSSLDSNWVSYTTTYFPFKNDIAFNKLLILYKKLFKFIDAVYGRSCTDSEFDAKHLQKKFRYMNWRETLRRGRLEYYGRTEYLGTKIIQHIPGIYWLTFFGPLYVNWLGEDVFKKIECTKKEKLPDGGYMLMRGSSPFDWQKKEIKKMEQQMIKLIGEDKVWQKKKPRASYLTPEFDLSEFDLTPLKERKMPIMEDYGKVFIPDPLDFIRKAPKRAEKIKTTFTAKGYPLTYDLRGVNYMEGFNLEDPVLAEQPLAQVDEELIREEISFFGETIKKLFRGEWQKGKNEQGEDSVLIVFTAKNGQKIKIDLLSEFIPRWQDVNALTDYLLDTSKEAGFDHKL